MVRQDDWFDKLTQASHEGIVAEVYKIGSSLAKTPTNTRSMQVAMLPARSPFPRIAIAVGVTLAIGLLSGLSVSSSVDTWFATLNRPWFAPPNWLFGPVWTTLYVLMGVAAGLVWNQGLGEPSARRTLRFYMAQLLLNAAWSFLFFGLRAMTLALFEMVILWGAIVLCMFAMARVNRASAWLMLPYICWVSFALILNAAYVSMN